MAATLEQFCGSVFWVSDSSFFLSYCSAFGRSDSEDPAACPKWKMEKKPVLELFTLQVETARGRGVVVTLWSNCKTYALQSACSRIKAVG